MAPLRQAEGRDPFRQAAGRAAAKRKAEGAAAVEVLKPEFCCWVLDLPDSTSCFFFFFLGGGSYSTRKSEKQVLQSGQQQPRKNQPLRALVVDHSCSRGLGSRQTAWSAGEI